MKRSSVYFGDLYQRHKKVKCEAPLAEWTFFHNLLPYEKNRWITAYLALRVDLDRDILRIILTDFMYVSCLHNSYVTPLEERFYVFREAPRLYAEIFLARNQMWRDKLEEEHSALVKSGVPSERVSRLFYEKSDPWHSHYCTQPYNHDFERPPEEDDDQIIVLPSRVNILCVDRDDKESIQKHVPYPIGEAELDVEEEVYDSPYYDSETGEVYE